MGIMLYYYVECRVYIINRITWTEDKAPRDSMEIDLGSDVA